MSAALPPLFKSGKYGGLPADQVPKHVLTFMRGLADLSPALRDKIERELARREAAATVTAPDPEHRELLPEPLQGGAPVEFAVSCAHCGRRNIIRGAVDTP
jgi:hypothetical protein